MSLRDPDGERPVRQPRRGGRRHGRTRISATTRRARRRKLAEEMAQVRAQLARRPIGGGGQPRHGALRAGGHPPVAEPTRTLPRPRWLSTRWPAVLDKLKAVWATTNRLLSACPGPVPAGVRRAPGARGAAASAPASAISAAGDTAPPPIGQTARQPRRSDPGEPTAIRRAAVGDGRAVEPPLGATVRTVIRQTAAASSNAMTVPAEGRGRPTPWRRSVDDLGDRQFEDVGGARAPSSAGMSTLMRFLGHDGLDGVALAAEELVDGGRLHRGQDGDDRVELLGRAR